MLKKPIMFSINCHPSAKPVRDSFLLGGEAWLGGELGEEGGLDMLYLARNVCKKKWMSAWDIFI